MHNFSLPSLQIRWNTSVIVACFRLSDIREIESERISGLSLSCFYSTLHYCKPETRLLPVDCHARRDGTFLGSCSVILYDNSNIPVFPSTRVTAIMCFKYILPTQFLISTTPHHCLKSTFRGRRTFDMLRGLFHRIQYRLTLHLYVTNPSR